MNDQVLLSIPQWCKKYGLSRGTCYKLMSSGQLEFVAHRRRRLSTEIGWD